MASSPVICGAANNKRASLRANLEENGQKTKEFVSKTTNKQQDIKAKLKKYEQKSSDLKQTSNGKTSVVGLIRRVFGGISLASEIACLAYGFLGPNDKDGSNTKTVVCAIIAITALVSLHLSAILGFFS
jgi:hypothetical protein